MYELASRVGRTALKRMQFERSGFPVAPGWMPGVGHVPALMTALPWLLREGDRLGPLFWLHLGASHWQLASVREEVFAIFRNRETSSELIAREAGGIVGRSLIGVDGDPHRRMRGALNPAFTPKGLTASRAGELMASVIVPRVEGWRGLSEVSIANETREFAVNVIFRMMGIPARDLVEWRIAFEEFGLGAVPIAWDFPGSPRRRGNVARRWIDAHLGDIIREARATDPESSMVAGMVQGRDEEGRGLDHDELLDNLRLLVFAGHETTASTMAWAMLYLAERRELWDRLVDETLSLDALPTHPEHLAKTPFAEGVFREALRLKPPVTMDARETIAPWTLFGATIQPGTKLSIGLERMSRDPSRYPDPDRFLPERWMGRKQKPGPIETAQFGGGPHFCLGYHVAWLEAVMFLAAVARTFGREKLRPEIVGGRMPRPSYFPLQRPPRSAKIRFVR